jgi:hypothetical protein
MNATRTFAVDREIVRLRERCVLRGRSHGASTLVKNVDLRIVLVVMREYSVMHAHRVRESIALQVLDGSCDYTRLNK